MKEFKVREQRFMFWLPYIKQMTDSHSLRDIYVYGEIPDSAVPLQWTGIKIGKYDLYEGHIVELAIPSGKELGVATWDQDRCGFVYISIYTGQIEHYFPTRIIGHIFTHPELLTIKP